MNEQYSALRSNVSMLGKVLGDTIKDALGRTSSTALKPSASCPNLPAPVTRPVAGAAHHLAEPLERRAAARCPRIQPVPELANTAEQYHSISPKAKRPATRKSLPAPFVNLKTSPTSTKRPSKSGGIPFAGAGADRTPNRNHPSYADPQNGGSEQLSEAVG